MSSKARLLPLLLVAAVTARCSCGKGSIEGTLRPFEGANAAGFVQASARGELPVPRETLRSLTRDSVAPRHKFNPIAERVIPSEVVLRLEEGIPASRINQLLSVGGLKHSVVTTINGHTLVLRFEDELKKPLSVTRTHELISALATRKGVKWVEANERAQATAIPNDKLYSNQWHYPLMNLPAAWDLTQGSSSIVVAVLDTGIVPHPDLDGRVLPGADLISDPATAGDGDGRDSNPLDMGEDLPNGDSSWHGTHVAGTIGASTNNTTGVAGVDWNARLLPVRVLGRGGGAGADIAAGIVWAVGGTVDGLTVNQNMAHVINMSLGGSGPPSNLYQDAINFAVERGAVVVVAAGNEDMNTSNARPCNQQSVICVGATRLNGQRASYSNFGTQVDVMGPGGETSEDLNGDGFPDGVLSTYRSSTNQPNSQFLQGTSMATPHVAGLAALMKAATAGAISPTLVEQYLKETAGAGSQCSEGCGAGMVNAQAAILRAQNASAGPGKLVVSTSDLFISGSGKLGFTATNTGGTAISSVSIAKGGTAAGALTLGSSSFSLNGLEMRRVEVDVNASGLAAGTHTATLTVSGGGESAVIAVKIRAGSALNDKTAVVAALYQDEAGEWQLGGGGEITGATLLYKIEADPRDYVVLAAVDDNGNGEFFEDGERFGFWRSMESLELVTVAEGQAVTGIDINLVPFEDVGSDALVPGASCGSDAACPTGFCAGWSGGYCTRACDEEACPAGSSCTELTDGFFCLAPCTGPGAGQSTCRSDYVCYADGTGSGVCLPSCPTSACGQGYSCVNGYCE